MTDSNTDNASEEPSDDLRNKGITQLESEILLLEQWLGELDETSDDNIESINARKHYMDMIQSRRDVLELLR